MIDESTVTRIAKLARIAVQPEEKAAFAAEISGILQWIAQLEEVDTAGVPQMTSVAAMHLPWREDAVTDGNRRDAVLKNAPAQGHGCFEVPKVIE